eukprot:4968517-Alexandrium_andersonii.AAC.1
MHRNAHGLLKWLRGSGASRAWRGRRANGSNCFVGGTEGASGGGPLANDRLPVNDRRPGSRRDCKGPASARVARSTSLRPAAVSARGGSRGAPCWA